MLSENFRQKYSCDGIHVPERAIEKGVGDSTDKSIVHDTEKIFEGNDSAAMEEFKKIIRCDSPQKKFQHRSLWTFLNSMVLIGGQ